MHGTSRQARRRMRRVVATLPVAAALLVVQPAMSHAPCRAQHGARYCRAHALRVAVRTLRARERHQAVRLGLALRSHRPLTWKVGTLWRASRWNRHELSELEARPTPVPIPHRSAWLCLVIPEAGGDWSMAPPASGGAYWGGLQMDIGFQRTYGSDMIARHHGGLANTWTPDEQMQVAERAWNVRGFEPWSTRGACGL